MEARGTRSSTAGLLSGHDRNATAEKSSDLAHSTGHVYPHLCFFFRFYCAKQEYVTNSSQFNQCTQQCVCVHIYTVCSFFFLSCAHADEIFARKSSHGFLCRGYTLVKALESDFWQIFFAGFVLRVLFIKIPPTTEI